jgi:hypothetical protein
MLSQLSTAATNWHILYQLRMTEEYQALAGMRIGRGKQNTWLKLAPV